MGGPGSGRKKNGSNTKKNKDIYKAKVKAGSKVMLEKYKKLHK
jgi:hypothetical protein